MVTVLEWIVQIVPDAQFEMYGRAVWIGVVWSVLTHPLAILSSRVGLLRYYRTAVLSGWLLCGVVLVFFVPYQTIPTLPDGTPYLVSATPSEMATHALLIGSGWAALTAPMVVTAASVVLGRYYKTTIVGGWLLCGAVLWVIAPYITVRPAFVLWSYPISFPVVAVITSYLMWNRSTERQSPSVG